MNYFGAVIFGETIGQIEPKKPIFWDEKAIDQNIWIEELEPSEEGEED